jgi:hypothetical protein
MLITTPSARAEVASRYLLTAQPPLLGEEGKTLSAMIGSTQARATIKTMTEAKRNVIGSFALIGKRLEKESRRTPSPGNVLPLNY